MTFLLQWIQRTETKCSKAWLKKKPASIYCIVEEFCFCPCTANLSSSKHLYPNWATPQAPTYDPLPILCPQANDLHFHIGATDRGQHSFHLCPHAQHGATQHVVGSAAQPHLTHQPQACLLAVASPADTEKLSKPFCKQRYLISLKVTLVVF